MKTLRSRRQMIFYFLPGFLMGILYMNLVFKKYGGVKQFYISDFLIQYYNSNAKRVEYFVYIMRLRIVEFAVLAALMVSRVKKQAAILVLIWTGFLFGILMSVSVISMGIKGTFFCVAALMPQIVFYLAAYVIILSYGIISPYSQWNRQKTEFVLGCLLAGILAEAYVNPQLLKIWIRL